MSLDTNFTVAQKVTPLLTKLILAPETHQSGSGRPASIYWVPESRPSRSPAVYLDGGNVTRPAPPWTTHRKKSEISSLTFTTTTDRKRYTKNKQAARERQREREREKKRPKKLIEESYAKQIY